MSDHRIRTFTGKMVDPFDLQPEDIEIEDIAHALSRIPRFMGHTAGFLSVASHCVHTAKAVLRTDTIADLDVRQDAFCALLHDASEAYLCDIPAPVKRRPEMQPYRDAEERVHQAIAIRFGSLFPHPVTVTRADARQLQVDLEYRRNNPLYECSPVSDKMWYLNVFNELRPGAGEVPL